MRKCKYGKRIKKKCPTKLQAKKAKATKRRRALKRRLTFTPEQDRAAAVEVRRIFEAPPSYLLDR